MAIGLSRKFNLSEKNLNLSEAIQKLYAPGIQDDIELFSLSSQIKSFIVSGQETNPESQIIALRSESLQLPDSTVVKRTKFLTKDLTYSNNDNVFFDTFSLSKADGDDVVNPILSVNGSIPDTKIVYGGRGYYFKKAGVEADQVKEFNSTVTVNNVVLKGKTSGSTSARASVTFAVDPDTVYASSTVDSWTIQGNPTVHLAGDTVSSAGGGAGNSLTLNADGSWSYASAFGNLNSSNVTIVVTYSNGVIRAWPLIPIDQSGAPATGEIALAPIGAPQHLTKWTGYYTLRFYISEIEITNGGSQYIIGEDLEIQEGTVVIDSASGASCVIIKQEGEEFFGRDPIVVSNYYFYKVSGSSQNGFYLYDEKLNKYMYLASEVGYEGFSIEPQREIRILREDYILIDNILQLKFSQSRVYLNSYVDGFSAGDSLANNVFGLSNTARNLRNASYRAVQNTKLPTPVTSDDNILGFEYNKVTGQNMDIWQRFVIRDQDFILGTNGVTGFKLASNVDNFKLTDESVDIRVPGLFLKVGDEYIRAYSTTTKPYSQVNTTGGYLNPNVDGSPADYALYAANRYNNAWYGYDTVISKFAQRIHSNGTDGAFYFHRSSAPTVTTRSSGGVTFYEVPLFTFVP